jgi:hypothetical protein
MANLVFNVAKGSIKHRVDEGATLRLLVLQVASADATLIDLDTVAAVLANGSTDEADFTNYARVTLAGVAVAVNDTDNKVTLDFNDIVFTSAGGATNNTTVKAVIYDFITDDTGSIPLLLLDCVFTTDGNNVTLTVPSGGIWESA